MAASQPHQGRSVMLTRFKLSQQRRQLREKERRPTAHSPKAADERKTKATVSPAKVKKERPHQTQEVQNMKGRSPSQVLLKQRHEMKVMGGSGGKRKLGMPQKGSKSPPAKRARPRHTLKSGPTALGNRSRSPVYSELGFEEVIRMVDENQSLDDDDLLEILTCPSPVWWEDPPDGDYMESPIILKSRNISPLPTPATKLKIKSARKTKPHKIILESVDTAEIKKQIQDNKLNTDTLMDIATFNVNSANDKFKNKRSKLESLLGTIKSKLNECKSRYNSINTKEEQSIKERCTDNADIPKRKNSTDHKNISDTYTQVEAENVDDICFAAITEQDKECLEHLENIEIPMERKRDIDVQRIDGNPKPLVASTKGVINPIEHLKVFKKSKTFPRYVTNKRVKILNFKKLPMNLLTQKKSSFREKRKSTESSQTAKGEEQVDVVEQNNIKTETNQTLLNEEAVRDCGLENVVQNASCVEKSPIETKPTDEVSKLNDKIDEPKVPSEETRNFAKTDDYITVFKIVSNSTDTKEVKSGHLIEVEIEEDTKKEPAYEKEIPEKETNTLDSYYKKCKSFKREPNRTGGFQEELEERDTKKEEDGTEAKELCDSCNNDSKMSIIVPSTADVKYCMKCSSIFDLDECDYCIRKERRTESPGKIS
ncbi:unnamed protein product, partial [Iphiclides podalirius]